MASVSMELLEGEPLLGIANDSRDIQPGLELGVAVRDLVLARSTSRDACFASTSTTHSGVTTAGGGLNGGSSTHLADCEQDIVQFSAPMYFVEEAEGTLIVDVMRLGSMKGECKVSYSTTDVSAVAGGRYEAAAGEVVLGDGESEKSIQIGIIDSSHWETTLEFKVCLASPRGCQLGSYLHTCRVKVIDNNMFPSSVYHNELEHGCEKNIEKVPGPALFREYLKLVYASEGIAWRTIVYLILSQMENVYAFFVLYVNIYLIDVLFHVTEETEEELLVPSREDTATIIGILYVLPMFILHACNYQRVRLDLAGMAQEFLQLNFIRKYLNFSERSREAVHPSTVQTTIIRDTVMLAEGYVASMELIQVFGRLCIFGYFCFIENRRALIVIVTMPIAMFLFVRIRSKGKVAASLDCITTSTDVAKFVQECCANYRLVADYKQRPQMCDIFTAKCRGWVEQLLLLEKLRTNDKMFPRWLGALFIGVYMSYGAPEVLQGTLKLGTFLATLKIFAELSEKFEEAFECLEKLDSAQGPLKKLTMMMNKETDLNLCKEINRKRRQRTQEARKSCLKNSSLDEVSSGGTSAERTKFKSDLIEIAISEMGMSFSSGVPVLRDVNVSVQQGKTVAVVGKHGSGKSTFLRLLGHAIFPDSGDIFVPTYLRILHVSQDPQFLSNSMLENLTFGVPGGADLKRVKEILRELGGEHLQGFIDEEREDVEDNPAAGWHSRVTFTEQAKLHLARALIMNPEVLVLQRPLVHYDVSVAESIMGVIETYVRNRGVCLPHESYSLRRPRTLFFSPNTYDQAKRADIIWQCAGNGVVRESSFASIASEELL